MHLGRLPKWPVWSERARWRWRAGLLVLLVLGGMAGLCVLALHLYSTPERSLPGRDEPCGGRPPEGVQLKVEGRVEVGNRDYPRITSTTTFRLPAGWVGSSTLLAEEDRADYRDAMRCLLAVRPDDVRKEEWRERPPTVVLDGRTSLSQTS